MARQLQENGFVTYGDLLDGGYEALQGIDDLGVARAEGLLDWASEKVGGDEEEEERPALSDDEFMAALSQALKESERRRASYSGNDVAEGGDEPTAE